MDSDTIEGAAATAEYYFAVMDYARTTGDTTTLRTLGDPGCGYCDSMATFVEDLAAVGGWVEGSSNTLSDIRVDYPTAELPEYVVYFTLTAEAATMHTGSGTTQEAAADSWPNFALGALWNGTGYTVIEIVPDVTA